MFGTSVQQICTRCALLCVLAIGTYAPALAKRAAVSPSTLASARGPADRLVQYSDLAVHWMEDDLRIDATNPPGHEMQAATFFSRILDQEGIENRGFECQPGRANLWARLAHSATAAKRPIILLNHMDVVTSDPSHWKVPPSASRWSTVPSMAAAPRTGRTKAWHSRW
jgi:hypothetical protein